MSSPGETNFALVTRGVRLRELRRFEESEAALKEALALNPEDDFALHQLAVTQYLSQNGEKKALGTAERAISLSPNDPDHHVLKAFILVDLGRSKDAFRSAKDALALDPNLSNAHAAQAAACLGLSQHEAAERCARKALELDADNDTAAKYLAHALRLQGRMEENSAHIQTMLSRDPNDAGTHSVAGYSALQSGKPKDAETHFLEALRLNPTDEYARNGLLESFRARSLFYRQYLKWTMWMESKSQGTQFGIIIGLYLLIRLTGGMYGTPYEPLAILLIVLYTIFAFWIHVARGIGNFMVLRDSSARFALKKQEKLDGIVVGGGIVTGLLLLLAGFLTGIFGLQILGCAFVLAAVPLAYTSTNPSRTGRAVFSFAGLLVIFTGVLGAAAFIMPGYFAPDFQKTVIVPLMSASVIAVIGTTWLVNIPYLRR